MTATASVTDDGYVLNGRKGPVEAGAQADHLLVVANTDDGPVQLLVPAATPGVTVVAAEGLDLTRRYAEIQFDDVRVPRACDSSATRRPWPVTSNGSCSSPT